MNATYQIITDKIVRYNIPYKIDPSEDPIKAYLNPSITKYNNLALIYGNFSKIKVQTKRIMEL